jgi:hypothetical protein
MTAILIKIAGSHKSGRPLFLTRQNAGAGSMGRPPNHASHFFGIVGGVDRGRGFQEYASVDSYRDSPEIHGKVRALLDREGFDPETFLKRPMLPLDHPRVEAWVRSQYAYFHTCYSPDGKDRNVSCCLTGVKPGERPPEHHLAHLAVVEFYPEAKPRLDLIENPPKWGKGGEGHWWETFETRPSPEKCPGDRIGRHPVNGSWCQFCGWTAPEEAARKE